MFESERYKVLIKYVRGPGWEPNIVETEIIHRCPTSDEGWCLFQSRLTWWFGLQGVALSLLYGSPDQFSKILSQGADYKSLSKFQIPNKSHLTEISCEGMIGICCKHWLFSSPREVQGSIVRVHLHLNWSHLHEQHNKARVLGHHSKMECDSVRTDHQLFETLVTKILGQK